RSLGAECEILEDGFRIQGSRELPNSITVEAHGDHRIAMAGAIAACGLSGNSNILGAESVSVSYPGFFEDLNMIRGQHTGDRDQ
ncbi:MAG: hypothetical protein WBD02_05205, partial [Acidimicrobiia bacterium]